MTEVAPVAVWIPWSPGYLDPFSVAGVRTPRVFGASGFGPSVVEVPDVVWAEMCGDRSEHLRVIGDPGPGRDAIVAELVAAYRRAFPGGQVTFFDGEVETFGVLDRGFRDAWKRMTPTSEPDERRLVVVALTPGPRRAGDGASAVLLDAIERRGAGTGWSILYVRSLAHRRTVRENAVEVFVLDGVVPSEAAGDGIAAALEAGVRSPSGIGAVASGAPVEWVRAYESGEKS